MEKVIKHEGNIKAERKEFLFIVPLIANQSFFPFIFICTNDAHTWSCRKIYMFSWVNALRAHTPSLTSVISVVCVLPDFLPYSCVYPRDG